jgi:Cd2+/Zn2+-exporting ATPase
LLNDEIGNVPRLVSLSRRFRAVVYQNIIFSLVTKALLVVVGIATPLPFLIAVVGDMGVSLVVTANALRLRS